MIMETLSRGLGRPPLRSMVTIRDQQFRNEEIQQRQCGYAY